MFNHPVIIGFADPAGEFGGNLHVGWSAAPSLRPCAAGMRLAERRGGWANAARIARRRLAFFDHPPGPIGSPRAGQRP